MRRAAVGTKPFPYLQGNSQPQSQRPFFFNRQAETVFLTEILNDDPVFSIVVGPPSCGKSALINHVLDQKLDDGRNAFHAIRIDLRGCFITDKSSLRSVLLDKSGLAASADKDWSALTRSLRSLEVSGPRWKLFGLTQENKTFNLDSLIPTIPRWPFGGDGRPYVLFIDEANELTTLASNDKETFRSFLSFIVRISKQDQRLHVLFASSDSLYVQWLTSCFGLKFEHVNTITLGDLPKAEAYRYFEHVIKTKHPEAKRELFPNEADFDKVFSITGGRMMYIKQYVGYVARSGSQPTVETSGIVRAAVSRVGLELDSGSRSEMLRIMEKLSLSESESLKYDELVKEIGFETVRQMIGQNLLYYRATESISGDSNESEPIVTASCVPLLRAMQQITQ
eukprot:CAMPEP_0172160678 /NCGR_PEP_ID=MMETSP1050-20130122/5690_1 /TAXON_ID=233186 /ORGANISM="Cryptomonas curvata, Strain CCAP979/52" /LENGTH=394 /DNA_ID=CAMNT_0012830465 /DNA_START=110 /DNA_END=1294 /DNA_ORIENTATION=+